MQRIKSRTTTRKCTGLPGCKCGRHGKRRANKRAYHSVKTSQIHLDRVLRPFDAREFHADAPAEPVTIKPLPVDTPYIAGVVVRDNNTLCGLPTTRAGFQSFLADWLSRPGRSLADIELLAPPSLAGHDISMTICDTAALMAHYDLLTVRA